MNETIIYKAIALLVLCSLAFSAGYLFRGSQGSDDLPKMSTFKLKNFLSVYNIALILSVALYAICLALPAYMPIIDGVSGDKYLGLTALMIGPFGLIAFHFSWLANICLWFAWSKAWLGRQETAIAWSLAGLCLALFFLLHDRMPVGSSGIFPFKIMIAYYVWLASIFCALVAAFTVPTTKVQRASES